jgi:hypothetical protein
MVYVLGIDIMARTRQYFFPFLFSCYFTSVRFLFLSEFVENILQLFWLYAVREFGFRPVMCLFFFWWSILCSVMSRRERVAWRWFLVILYHMDSFFDCIILYHIFMFNLVELVRPFCSLCLLAGLTRLTCLSGSHIQLQFYSHCLSLTFPLSLHYSRFLS